MDLHEITRLIEDQGDVFKSRLGELDAAVRDLERKAGRPVIGGGASSSEAKAFKNWMRTGETAPELKSMMVGSDPAGGFSVPEVIDSELTKNLRDRSPMRQLARVVNTTSGELKLVHSTGGTAATWVTETQTRPETTSPSFAMVTVPAHELYASPGITQTLLDDSAFNLERWIVDELTDAFDEAEGTAFLTGTGVGQPRGLFTYPTATTADATRDYGTFGHVVSGANGALHTDKLDPFVRLIHAVRPAYRAAASFLMSDELLEVVRKVKETTTDRPIWEPSLQAGQPDRLFGYPVFTDTRVPALATGSLSCAFGDFSRAYVITDRKTMALRDPFTSKPLVLFYASRRVGGGAGTDTNAVKFMKFSA